MGKSRLMKGIIWKLTEMKGKTPLCLVCSLTILILLTEINGNERKEPVMFSLLKKNLLILLEKVKLHDLGLN